MPPGSIRLSISPCSSRSTMAWCRRRRLRRPASPPPDAWLASLRKRCSIDAATSAPVVSRLIAIALIGVPSATQASSCSSAGDRSESRRGRTSASTIFGSSSEPPVVTARTALASSARRSSGTIRLSSASSTLIRPISVSGRAASGPSKGASVTQSGWLALVKEASRHHRPQLHWALPCRAEVDQMKYESSVTAVSWIPFDAVKGFLAMPFDMGLAHYDEPLPSQLDDIDGWHRQDLFREANELRGWIEVEGGRITGYGQAGKGRIGATRLKLGPKTVTVKAKPMPDIRPLPEVTDTYVRFTQTCG